MHITEIRHGSELPTGYADHLKNFQNNSAKETGEKELAKKVPHRSVRRVTKDGYRSIMSIGYHLKQLFCAPVGRDKASDHPAKKVAKNLNLVKKQEKKVGRTNQIP